ncbi:TMC family-containing protein [Strongyloides ratti]|uniref:TMC family-containing protein n=1 Tax=Strongyloides ratti TaxID=34506 RepID=A0A090L2U8_STRRB|nr:TMC family-containing protein [Strongyloides ratti]CEF64131.1 TMC family-containing protein [Strongyloides ratti]
MLQKIKTILKCNTKSNAYEEVIDEADEQMYKTFEMEERRKSHISISGSSQTQPHIGMESSEEDSSATKLARRSSVLLDLFSLFRKSSSSNQRNSYIKSGRTSISGVDGFEGEDTDDEDPTHMSKERLMEAIRQKKEIIGKVRCQPWNMKRKRRTLKVAQHHLQRQEARVSKVNLYKVEAVRIYHVAARWFENLKIYLIPWENKIKRIESHFGSVVSSYFIFLRWVLGVNIIISLIMLLFICIPEWLADNRLDIERYNKTQHIKIMPESIKKKADELSTVWDFGGYFQYSLLFYGYYSSETFFGDTVQYKVPLAYFVVNLLILAYSFFVILRKMASNARNSKMGGSKAEQYVFNWKTFTGWDYTIGNAETSSSLYMANVIKFRESIAEYNVKIKKKFAWLQLAGRILANVIIIIMLALSVWAIIAVIQIREKDTFIKQNAVSITVSFITLIFPNIFELIGKLECYHPRIALRLQLARVLFLYIANYFTLIVSLMLMLNALEERGKASDYFFIESQFSTDNHYYENQISTPLIGESNFDKDLNNSEHYQIYSRHSRDIINKTLNNITTTISPLQKIWTTVFPNFGPIAVSNPKAIISPKYTTTDGSGNKLNDKIVYESRPIGPITWENRNKTIESIVLNYTTSSGKQLFSYGQGSRQGDLCWETLIGQEIMKIVNMDLIMTVLAILIIDFLRGLWVRYCNTWWCWNLECTFPEYGEFKVAENVLHLVNNQGMIWLGLFFVPMLPVINNIKLIILMYIRGWAVMTCNVPARQIFRASRSSNFYLMLLLLMLFLCTLPVGFVIASKKPSKNCGPFGNQPRFYSIIQTMMKNNLNKSLFGIVEYIMSPGIVIPIILLLMLTIYFLFALVRGLKEANTDLSEQLMHERTEEKKKIFELAGGGRRKHGKKDNNRRKSRSKNRKETTKGKKVLLSSDDESGNKSHSSIVKGGHSKYFIPSLGSVNEDDREGDEIQQRLLQENEFDENGFLKEPSSIKLREFTLKEKLLICIGMADPKEIREKDRMEELKVQENYRALISENFNKPEGHKGSNRDINKSESEINERNREERIGSPDRKSDITEYQTLEIENEEDDMSKVKNVSGEDSKIIVDYATPPSSYHEAIKNSKTDIFFNKDIITSDNSTTDSNGNKKTTKESHGTHKRKKRSPKFSTPDDRTILRMSKEEEDYSDDERSDQSIKEQSTMFNQNYSNGEIFNNNDNKNNNIEEVEHPLMKISTRSKSKDKLILMTSSQRIKSDSSLTNQMLTSQDKIPSIASDNQIVYQLMNSQYQSKVSNDNNNKQQINQSMYSSSSSGNGVMNSYMAAMQRPIIPTSDESFASMGGDWIKKISSNAEKYNPNLNQNTQYSRKMGYDNPMNLMSVSAELPAITVQNTTDEKDKKNDKPKSTVSPNRGRTSSPDKPNFTPRFRISASPPRRISRYSQANAQKPGSPSTKKRQYIMRVEGILTSDSERETSPGQPYWPSKGLRKNHLNDSFIKDNSSDRNKRSSSKNSRSPSLGKQTLV